MKKGKKGFTLIELLIVIAIIGILAVAMMPTILGAPAKGRDAARLSDLNTIVTSVEGANVAGVTYPAMQACIQGISTTAGFVTAVQSYFQGGTFPKDPDQTNSIAVGPCAKGQYLYCKLKGTSGRNYMVASEAELVANANAMGTYIPAGQVCDGTADLAPSAATLTGSGPWLHIEFK